MSRTSRKLRAVKGKPHAQGRTTGRSIYAASASDQFYTPPKLRFLAREVLGYITLDPATSHANPMRAVHWHTQGVPNGMRWEVDCGRLEVRTEPRGWLNPPYGRAVEAWLAEWRIWLARALPLGGEALALLPARLGTRWYERVTYECQAYCELRGRVCFEDAKGEYYRDAKGRPQPARWASVLCYWGRDVRRFRRIMREHGVVREGGTKLPPMRKEDDRQLTLLRLPYGVE